MPKNGHNAPLQRVRFGDFELHPDEAALLHRGRRLKLQPQPFRVLAYLIINSPAVVTKEELGEHVWEAGVHVDLDQSLGYCIRQIRQVLGDSATLPRYIETLPRQGYRFIGQPEVIPKASPDGRADARADELPAVLETLRTKAVPAQPAPRAASPRFGGKRRWALGGLAGLSLAVLLGLPGKRMFHTSPTPRVTSIAVLPLDNLSGDPGQEYLADGMTDELTTMLARDSTLRVVSRTSVMPYKRAQRSLPEIARTLGVDAVVEGSMARSDRRMHLTLQVIRADTDSHLWAESYDRDANDPTLPDQAARAIAKQLNSAAPSPETARFIAPAAHDAFLHGRYLWPTERMAESGAYFQRATEMQPDYAEAWAWLANYYGEGVCCGGLDPRTNRRLEDQAAERAMALAPHLGAAHSAMAGAYLISRWNAKSADQEVLLAISLDPTDAESYYLRGNILQALGRFDDSIQVVKKFMEFNPYERPYALASMYFGARMFDEALAEIKLRMEAAPNDADLLFNAKETWRCKGNYKEAAEAWAKWHVVTGDPKSAAEIRRAYQLKGAQGFVRWELKRRLQQAKSKYVSPVELASFYAQLGDGEHALPLLEEGYRQRSTDVLWIEGDPAFDFLHGESRYQAIVQGAAQSLAH